VACERPRRELERDDGSDGVVEPQIERVVDDQRARDEERDDRDVDDDPGELEPPRRAAASVIEPAERLAEFGQAAALSINAGPPLI
jgi:hypothetical protein